MQRVEEAARDMPSSEGHAPGGTKPRCTAHARASNSVDLYLSKRCQCGPVCRLAAIRATSSDWTAKHSNSAWRSNRSLSCVSSRRPWNGGATHQSTQALMHSKCLGDAIWRRSRDMVEPRRIELLTS